MEQLTVKESGEIQPVLSKYDKMVELAITSGTGVESLEKIMDLQERYEAGIAKKEFVVAMARFQKERPIIKQDKKGHHGYKYASLTQIESQIKAILADCGLSYRFEQSHNGPEMQVTCIVTHVGGHSERTMMSAPADDSGGKNAIQGLGSTNSYLQRYTLIGALGLTTADHDDDGVGANGMTVKDLLTFSKCLRDNFWSISAMKQALLEDDLDTAAECWHELEQEEKDILRRGSTRGGVITAEEAKKIKDDPEKRFVTRVEAK